MSSDFLLCHKSTVGIHFSLGYEIVPTKPRLRFLRLSQVSPVFRCSFDTLATLDLEYHVDLHIDGDVIFNTTFMSTEDNADTRIDIDVTLSDMQDINLRDGVRNIRQNTFIAKYV